MKPNAAASHANADAAPQRRLRFELLFASVLLAVGLFALPAVVYSVGLALLGPYGENQGAAAFYADFYSDLARPSGRAWALALGPLALVLLLRAVFVGLPAAELTEASEEFPDDEPQARPAAARTVGGTPDARSDARVEPRITLD